MHLLYPAEKKPRSPPTPIPDKFSKKANIFVSGALAGHLFEIEAGTRYEFHYLTDYTGPPISLTMPTSQRVYYFDRFPVFFEGFLPEGMMLEMLLKKTKIESDDFFEQLMRVGEELVGAVTVDRCV